MMKQILTVEGPRFFVSFLLTLFLLFLCTPASTAVTRGPNLCDGRSTEWDLPYACDLNQPYAEEFLVTDGRTVEDDGAPQYYEYYETVDSYNIHTLDVFYPESCLETQDCTVFINVHGGAWKDYYKAMIDSPDGQHASWFMTGRKGWIVVVPDYRLCDPKVYTAKSCPAWPDDPVDPRCTDPEQAAVYPDNVNDIDAIVDWVYKNAHIYGARNSGGAEKYATDVWLLGHSAGGHLVMDWATNPMFETERHKVRGVIGLSGAYDIPNLSPMLSGPVENTFKAHSGKTANQWQISASPTRNVEADPAYPYPKLMILDTGENDLFNLGNPQTIRFITYPDIAQEFADKLGELGYRVTENGPAPWADLLHVKLNPDDYGHIDEYAALSFTGDDSNPDYFEPLYLPWVENPDCNNSADTLGPNNGDVSDGCAHFAKPAGGSWPQPTDLIAQWIEYLNHPKSHGPLLLLLLSQ